MSLRPIFLKPKKIHHNSNYNYNYTHNNKNVFAIIRRFLGSGRLCPCEVHGLGTYRNDVAKFDI